MIIFWSERSPLSCTSTHQESEDVYTVHLQRCSRCITQWHWPLINLRTRTRSCLADWKIWWNLNKLRITPCCQVAYLPLAGQCRQTLARPGKIVFSLDFQTPRTKKRAKINSETTLDFKRSKSNETKFNRANRSTPFEGKHGETWRVQWTNYTANASSKLLVYLRWVALFGEVRLFLWQLLNWELHAVLCIDNHLRELFKQKNFRSSKDAKKKWSTRPLRK